MTDLLIIGAGLAGLMAAHTAATAGKSVKVIAKGFSTTHWHAGTIDVLGYFPNASTLVDCPLDKIVDVVRAQPQHPYALANIDDALKNFAALSQTMGLPYAGAKNPGENVWLPSPIGAARPTFLAPQSQLAGDLKRTAPMLIVGVRGVRDFYPALIAENLRKQGHSARAAFVPLDVITERTNLNPAQLAEVLDEPARRDKFGDALKKMAQPGERIGVPAILGMHAYIDVWQNLQTQTGADIFEIPTLPPSVPGVRLSNALRNHLRNIGVRVDLNMQVIGFHAEGDRIVYVESEASGRPLKHHAEKFLLATGGILGGGIDSNLAGKIWETIFNLPLIAPENRGQWFRARFFDSAGHPVFRAGVPVNRDFQPIDANGKRVYANLWAAGNLLAHADSILERSLEGVALASGIQAAHSVIKQ